VRNISRSGTEKIFIFSVAASPRLRARQIQSTEAHFRSTLALDGCWHRLERNLAADVAAAWSGATLTGVRGMAFHAYHASSAMWVDDVRFSNAMTLERNSLLPGAVGQIACRRATDATNFGHADAFYFYDHIGNVQGVSSSGGAVAESYVQDAWGNVLASATTGQWATSFAGRHLTTKEQDADVGMYYFWQRWHESPSGRFISPDPYTRPITRRAEEHYKYCDSAPTKYTDPDGLRMGIPIWVGYCMIRISKQVEREYDPAGGLGDKYMHCLVSCRATQECCIGLSCAEMVVAFGAA
jgi:RHS repeat-associated protein